MATVDVLELIVDLEAKLEDLADVTGGLEAIESLREEVDDSVAEIIADIVDGEEVITEMLGIEQIGDRVDGKEIELDVDVEDLEQALLKLGLIEEKFDSNLVDSDFSTASRPSGFTFDPSGTSRDSTSPIYGSTDAFNQPIDPTLGGRESSTGGMRRFEKIVPDLGGTNNRKLSRKFKELTNRIEVANLRMSQFWSALADVLPLLIVFAVAMAPVISGLIALAAAAVAAAGAMGAIAGLGLFGMGAQEAGGTEGSFGEVADRLKEVGNEILATFEPLARSFAPLMRDALNGLVRTVERVVEASQGLLQLRDSARAFGAAISDAIVAAITLGTRLADAFMPVFSMIADFFRDNFESILNTMTQDFADVLPHLITLVHQLMNALRVLVEAGKGFLVVTVIVFDLLGAIYGLVDAVLSFVIGAEDANKAMGLLIGSLLAGLTLTILFARAIRAYNVVKSAEILLTIKSAVAYSYEYITRLKVLTIIPTMLTWLVKEIAAKIESAIASYFAASGMIALSVASAIVVAGLIAFAGVLYLIAKLLGVAGRGVAGLADQFNILGANVDDATKSLRNFGKVKSGMGGFGEGGGAGFGTGGGRGNYYETNIEVNGGDENTQRRETRKTIKRYEWNQRRGAGR